MIATSVAANGNIPSSSTKAAIYASIVGPIFLTFLLLFVSGLTLQERPGAKKRYEAGGSQWEAYKTYLNRTSILIPLPPALYAPLPTIIKRTLLLEWPIYVFDPAKHADAAAATKVGDDEAEAVRRGESNVNQV